MVDEVTPRSPRAASRSARVFHTWLAVVRTDASNVEAPARRLLLSSCTSSSATLAKSALAFAVQVPARMRAVSSESGLRSKGSSLSSSKEGVIERLDDRGHSCQPSDT